MGVGLGSGTELAFTMPLGEAQIRSLKPEDRDRKVADFGSLYLLVEQAGSDSRRFEYRGHGKAQLMVFADFPHIGLAKARGLRDNARSQLSAGLDPGEVKKVANRVAEAAKQETFAAVADEYSDLPLSSGLASFFQLD